ncbi:sugar transporter [Runella aurantiaca]|uniref:Sugar transporter n=1 Tax=Runella aurantiaca TaxID=2282308 RepID=A0A369ICW1_9BACT|nr:sugar transporter [Runella aurantiaca]
MTPQIRFFFFSFFCLTLTLGINAQTPSKVEQLSDSQVKAFYEKAKASGMSEMQIEQAALAQGFTLSDISLMRKRLAEVQDKENKEDLTDTDSLKLSRQQIGKLSKRDIQKDTLKIPKKEPLKVYGSELFNTEGLTFEPSLRIATPKNYQLGPDDELLVEIYGDAKGSYRLKVSPEGTVKVLNLAPIYVSGLTIEEARDKIVGRLRQSYAGLNSSGSFASINLGNIRSIKVMVTGEVVKPGVYTVSSLATAFNALYLCGGPNKNGSFRAINVIRNNKVVRTIDIYDFLLRASQADNIILQDQDIIQVPFYLTRVELDGEVKRPAIYELKKGETLQQLVDLAGGFNEHAYQASITMRRNTDKARKVVTVIKNEYATFLPQSGDAIMVGKVLERFDNKVVIEGAISRPGEYALGDNLKTLKDLINQSEGVREDAFLNRALIHREKPNREPEVIAVALGKVLSNELPDIELKNQDSVVISSIKNLREEYFVTIVGEINNPSDFPFAEAMTVSDLITQAGGLTDGAIDSRIEIARRIKDNNLPDVAENVTIQIITLKINRDLSLLPADKEFKLQPFDIVYIRKSTRYDKQRSVVILGEVNYPGTYAIQNNSERVTQLLERAGGPKLNGYLPNAVFRRDGGRIALDIQRIVDNPALESNIILEEGDTIFVPERSELVRIDGAVLNPSVVNYSKGFSYENYLSQAGGYGDRAMKSRVYVTYANGYTERTRKFLFFNIRPKIQPGSVISVPYKPKDERRSDLTGPVILSFTSTLILAAVTLISRL